MHSAKFLPNIQEELLPGGHGLMVRGYIPVINTLAKGLDIRLGHRYELIIYNFVFCFSALHVVYSLHN